MFRYKHYAFVDRAANRVHTHAKLREGGIVPVGSRPRKPPIPVVRRASGESKPIRRHETEGARWWAWGHARSSTKAVAHLEAHTLVGLGPCQIEPDATLPRAGCRRRSPRRSHTSKAHAGGPGATPDRAPRRSHTSKHAHWWTWGLARSSLTPHSHVRDAVGAHQGSATPRRRTLVNLGAMPDRA